VQLVRIQALRLDHATPVAALCTNMVRIRSPIHRLSTPPLYVGTPDFGPVAVAAHERT
jgi:hypothetical protein